MSERIGQSFGSRRLARVAVVAAGGLLCGCVAMDVPNDIEYSETISYLDFNCEEPVELSIGCARFIRTNIEVEVEGRKIALSSTEDGRVLAVAPRKVDIEHPAETLEAIVEGATLFLIDPQADGLGHAVRAVIAKAGAQGISLEDVKVVSYFGDVQAYLLLFDGDALTALGARPEDGWYDVH